MTPHTISRKTFIRNSAIAAFGLQIPDIRQQNHILASDGMPGNTSEKPILFKNMRLETGFEYEGDEVSGTKTDLFTIEIREGKISALLPNQPNATASDGQGWLMLPAFRDMHIHLDKTFFGGPWKAVQRKKGGVKGMIALEQKILPEMLKTSTERAGKLISLLQSKGSSFARSHVNIEPTSGLNSLKNLEKALAKNRNGFESELVAFPQHGLYYTKSAPLMKEAAQLGIDFIGGLDPYSIDGEIAKPMDFTVNLALEYDKGIDIHLHESGESGLKTVEFLIDRVNENPVLKGKTYLSHCFVLAKLDPKMQEKIAENLAEAGIGIISTIPFGQTIMPLPTLYKYDVKIATGNDSIIDHWNSWGTGSVLDKAKLFAQLYGYGSESGLSRSLRIATGDVLPLDQNGAMLWPKPGDRADFVLLDASCSAEAVSRVSPVKSLIHRGETIF